MIPEELKKKNTLKNIITEIDRFRAPGRLQVKANFTR